MKESFTYGEIKDVEEKENHVNFLLGTDTEIDWLLERNRKGF